MESLAAAPQEIAEKEARVRTFMSEAGLDALVLTTQANFAWFTCGGDNHVGNASEAGIASAVITPDAKYIVCDNIESRRILEEEAGGQGFEFITHNWWESALNDEIRKLLKGLVGSDTLVPGTKLVDITALRCSLTEQEINRYRRLGKATGECMSEVCRAIKPDMTEHKIASILDESLLSRGVFSNVLLIAVDDRISKYRHPIPTDKALERYAMVVTGARKWGLIISMTRIVHFGPVPAELRRKHDAVLTVDAEYIAHTKPGTPLEDVFRKGMEAYARTGFADEWKFHHQGGSTGYVGRENRAKVGMKETVKLNQAFGWNPSITGTKSEDTIIALADRTEIISAHGDWPMKQIEVGSIILPRPDILQL